MVGQTISHHRVIERLGAGGMGVVYKAEDLKLSRMVALKFLSLDRTQDPQSIERFEREARTASALNHPNICTIYEVDEHEGLQFIAMELLQGQPLDKRIGGRPLPIALLLELGIQIADALDTAHSSGILHRDIKPANIFITTRDQAKILDFGLAKLAESHKAAGALHLSGDLTRAQDEFLTTKGITVGTVAYMSPEQARGENLDARSDLFSFGVVLYEMATGRQTFSGSTSAVIFDAILNREPTAPIELNAEVPPDLERIIAKAIDKDRRLRYQTASEIRTDLQRLKRSRESNRVASSAVPAAASGPRWPSASGVAVPVGAQSKPVSAASRWALRWPLLVGAGGAICFVAAGILFFQSRGALPPTPPEANTAALQNTSVPPPASPEPTDIPPAPTAVPPVPTAAPPAPAAAPPAQAVAPPVRPTAAPPASIPPSKPAPVVKTDSASPPPQQPPSAEAPSLSPPTAVARATDPAADRLRLARSKFDAKLYDQALVDLKAITAENAASPSAPGAYLLMASTYERQGRTDDALAAYVELRDKYRSSPAAGEGTFEMANLMLRSKRSDRENAARELFADVAASYPKSPWAPRALMAKASLEERARTRVVDPQLKTSVPAALISYRTVAERYPADESAESAFWQLSEMYQDLDRFDLAAQALDNLASHFPNNKRDAQWRAAELYDRRVKDPAAARAAYARVPPASPHYRDAQRRVAER